MVSIIIPTYKRAQYIERAIYSILRQTYKDYEIIVVDDNNPNTEDRKKMEKIMKKYEKYPNIIYVKHDKNKNGAVARNTGIKLAKGEYITFLDDDDYFLKDRLETMVSTLEENKDYDAVYTSSLMKKEGYYWELREAIQKGDFKKEILKANSLIGTGSNLFFRAEALKSINGFNEEFLRHQDYEVLVRFFNSGRKIINVNKILVVKDKSNEINVPNSENALKYREKYLEYFKDSILRYDDADNIYLVNYLDLLHIATEDNNTKVFYDVLNKIKKYSKSNYNLNKKILIMKSKYYVKKIPIIKKIKLLLRSNKIKNKLQTSIIEEIKEIENFKCIE